MSPQTASNAAGLILAPFFLITAMQLVRWAWAWLGGLLGG